MSLSGLIPLCNILCLFLQYVLLYMYKYMYVCTYKYLYVCMYIFAAKDAEKMKVCGLQIIKL